MAWHSLQKSSPITKNRCHHPPSLLPLMRIWVNSHSIAGPHRPERYFTCGIQYWGPWGTGYGMGRWLTIMMCWLAWYTAVGVCAPGRMEGLLFGMVALGGCIWGLWKNWGGEKKYLFFYKREYVNFTILSFLLFPTNKNVTSWIGNTIYMKRG